MEHLESALPWSAAVVDPVSVVRQYVKRDANGERLGTNPWFESVVTWPQDPGYDSHTVIRSFQVEPPPTIAGSPATIMVKYEVIGWIVSSGFLPQEKLEAFPFVVVRTDEGWLIQSPQIDQHILPEAAAAMKFLTPEDATRIRELAAAPPPES
jgi:hypothetical protein